MADEPVIVDDDKAVSDLQERIQELEDLLLLIEMENTKIKEKIIGGVNMETPADLASRLQKLEEKTAAISVSSPQGMDKKIDDLEDYVSRELSQLDKRIARLEDVHEPAKKERPEAEWKKIQEAEPERTDAGWKEGKSTVFEEVVKILEG